MWDIGVWSKAGIPIHPTGVLWDSCQDSGLGSPFLEPYCPQTNPSDLALCLYRKSSSPNWSTVDSIQQVKMSFYPSVFRFPCSIMRGPSPFHEKHPHTVMPPPPNFTVGTTHAGRYRSPGIRHTQTLPLDHHMV
jgi:hypothetical protein